MQYKIFLTSLAAVAFLGAGCQPPVEAPLSSEPEQTKTTEAMSLLTPEQCQVILATTKEGADESTSNPDREACEKMIGEAAIAGATNKQPLPVPEHQEKFSGSKLGGSRSPLLEFNPADYTAAAKSGKLIVLYFYANWCPLCKAEFPKVIAAFDAETSNAVVGFRVNFNDTETSAEEKELAREFGVAYQHTKVFVKNGKRILKAPDSWDTARYTSEINKAK